MALPNYISLSRHNIYYFRYPLPRELHPQRKSSHIKLSLSTSNQREAMVIANMLTYHAETTLKTLRSTSMKYNEIRDTIKTGLNKLVEDSKTRRLQDGALNKNDRGSLEHWQHKYTEYHTQRSDEYYSGDMIVVNAQRKIDELFNGLDLNDYAKEQFTKEFIRQYPEAINAILDFDKNPDDIKFTGNASEQALETRTPLNEAIQRYVEETISGNNWKNNTAKQRKMHLNTLQAILGDTFIVETLNKSHARTVKDIVTKLPIDWKNNKKTKGLSIRKAVEVEKVKRICTKTSNEYIGAYITFGKWLVDHGYVEKNPFAGMKTKQGGKQKSENPRLPYTPAQMQQIISGLESNKIKNGRKQFRYWGVMIACFTGARLEEIAQLSLSDIREQDGVHYFDINDKGEHKDVKTLSSLRVIPIHQHLIDKGLLKYVQKLRDNGYDRLFPDLKHSEKHGFGRNLSAWYRNTYLPSFGFKEKGMDFHSFRTTVATQLGETGAQEVVQKRILGHSKAGDTTQANYDRSVRLKQMKEALEKLPY